MSFKAGAIVGEAILDTKQWNSGLKTLSKGAASTVKAVGVAFVAAMTVSIATANEFQKSMSNVATVIDTSQISTQDMTKALLQLDPRLGRTKELTDGLYNAYSAGAATMDEAMQITVDSAKFSKAALTDNATAVDVLTTAQNAYGKEVMNTTVASDIFFTTIKQGKITGEQLAGSIGQSIPLFASMGIELVQLGSGMAAMTKQGISANESTTQLNGIVNSFLKPSEAMSAALLDIGYASGAAFIEAEGLTGALDFLETSTEGNKDELAALLPNVNALKGAMALTGTGGKEYNRVLLEMKKSTGATDEAFAKQEMTFETLANQMDKIQVVAGNVGKSFVDKIAVGATTAAGGVLDFITSSAGMEAIANIIGFTGGVFDLLKTILTPLIATLLPELKTIFNTLGKTLSDIKGDTNESTMAFDVLGIATATLSAGFKIVSNVIQVTIESTGNLITAILASGETVSTFFKFLTKKATWDEVKAKATIAKEGFIDFGKGVVTGYIDVGKAVKDSVSSFTADAVVSSREIKTSFVTGFTEIKSGVINTWDELITGQEDFVDDSLDTQDTLIEGIIEGSEEIADTTGSIFTKMFDSMDTLFDKSKFSWKGLYDTITSTVGTAVSSLSKLSDQYFTNETAKITNASNDELNILQAKYDQGLITKEDFEAGKSAIDTAALVEQNKLAKEQFELNKAFNIASVWMDAASATAGFWATAPLLGPIAGPIFGGVMTGAMIGMGMAQTSLINDQQFVPAREKGGMSSGLTRVNEAGGEIISLPDGSQVIPNDISRQIANGSTSEQNININLYDTNIGNDVDFESMYRELSRRLGEELRRA